MSTGTHTSIPMKGALLGSLSMAWAWGVIAGSVGLNSLIKSNQQKSSLRKNVPPPTVIHIDVMDAFQSGVVLTTVAALIAVLCTIFFLMLTVPITQTTAVRSLRTQSFILAFCATWLFATLVPFTVFFATRRAKVTAFIGAIELPQQIIQQAEQALGTTSVYRRIGYLRLVAILPWFTVLFTAIAAVVMFIASRKADKLGHTGIAATRDSHSDHGVTDKDGGKPVTA